MAVKIHSPNTLVRGGITEAMADVVDGHSVVLRVGAVTDGVRGTRIQGRTKPPAKVIGRVFALIELNSEQIAELEKKHSEQ